MADWADLPEAVRREYMAQIRSVGVELQDYNSGIGLRPILPGSADSIEELYGPSLEKLCELEHNRRVQELIQDGWHRGAPDPEAKTSPDMVSYEELEEARKEELRLSVRNIPENLREIGFELYRKSV